MENLSRPMLACLLAVSTVLLVVSDVNCAPRSRLNFNTDSTRALLRRFGGNETHRDYFKILLTEGDSMVVGARNVIYNISLITMKESMRITWFSTNEDIRICRMTQKSYEQCQNYIRVLARKTDSHLFVCGTNAFRPKCRTYHNDGYAYQLRSEQNGIAMCPHDPFHNSTAVYTGGRLFSGSVVDVTGRDALIYSSPLRTEQHDSQWLNNPDFVSSFAYGDKVYMFFRETATEQINCGKAIFSRVARVCKNDEGGERVLINTWTSFFKARLNCSIPGEYPFYFDEIQATSVIGQGNYMPPLISRNRTDLIYAVFNTPRNSISGSAVCAFRLSDITESFDGQFKEQRTAHSNWLPVGPLNTPDPHPARTCVNNSRLIPDQTLNFIKTHPLMNRAVPSFGGQPVVIDINPRYRLTQLAIDWQVPAADARFYDVLFIGTDDGRVLKAVNKGRGSAVETVVIEELAVFADSAPVTSLHIHRAAPVGVATVTTLVVVSDDEMKAIALHRCELRSASCRACVALQDPYCSWLNNSCVNSIKGVQNIERGEHQKCGVTTSEGKAETEREEGDSSSEGVEAAGGGDRAPKHAESQEGSCAGREGARFGATELAVATVASVTLSLAVGFVVGYKVAGLQRRHLAAGLLTRGGLPTAAATTASPKGTNQLVAAAATGEHEYSSTPCRPGNSLGAKQMNATLDGNIVVNNLLNDVNTTTAKCDNTGRVSPACSRRVAGV